MLKSEDQVLRYRLAHVYPCRGISWVIVNHRDRNIEIPVCPSTADDDARLAGKIHPPVFSLVELKRWRSRGSRRFVLVSV